MALELTSGTAEYATELTAVVFSKPANSAFLLALVAAFAPLIAARAGASVPQSGSTEAVRQYLQMEMVRRHIPGMQVAVIQHGRIVFLAAMGVANIDRQNLAENVAGAVAGEKEDRVGDVAAVGDAAGCDMREHRPLVEPA